MVNLVGLDGRSSVYIQGGLPYSLRFTIGSRSSVSEGGPKFKVDYMIKGVYFTI
jgi:hypothetical protein